MSSICFIPSFKHDERLVSVALWLDGSTNEALQPDYIMPLKLDEKFLSCQVHGLAGKVGIISATLLLPHLALRALVQAAFTTMYIFSCWAIGK